MEESFMILDLVLLGYDIKNHRKQKTKLTNENL